MSTLGSASAIRVDLAAVQRRTVRVLIAGQVFGGVGIGATLSIGAVLAADVSGSEAWSGASATLSTLGAAAAAVPLARLAARAGRRLALTLGVLASAAGAIVTVLAAAGRLFPLLLLGFALLGTGAAVNLQSRFAATDLAAPSEGAGTSPSWCGRRPWEPSSGPTSSAPGRASPPPSACRP